MELVQLSDWLGQLQDGLHKVGEIDTLWIGGGSARAILDHIYFDKPLVMRDLDIFIVADREVTADFVEKIGSYMEGDSFGYFSRQDLRDRPRVPFDKPVLNRNHYVAGYGLHWIRANGEILDLSVYHSQKDLDLNGIFDIDTTMIPLRLGQSLIDFREKAVEQSYDELMADGSVYDRFEGYKQWVQGKSTIVNWVDIESDPVLKSCRIVHSCVKTGRHLTQEEISNFHYLLKDAAVKNPLQMTRSLLKILEGQTPVQELTLLKELGLFNCWLTPLKSVEFDRIDFDKVSPLAYGRGDHLALAKLFHLIQQLPDQNDRLAVIYHTMSCFDVNTLVSWIYQELFGEEKVFETYSRLSNDRIKKICASTVLSQEEKGELFLREIENQWVNRKGIITGGFNPVHLGQVEGFKEAINEMVLDELWVIVGDCYYAEISWKDRYAMMKLVQKEIKELKVMGPEYQKMIANGMERAVHALVSQDPNADWIRVLGSDIMKEYCDSGAYKQESCDAILVIQREDPIYMTEEGLKKVYFKPHEPETASHQKRHQSKNSRKLAFEGKDTSDFVTEAVAQYIQEHQLYQNQCRIYCVSTNSEKFRAAKKIFPHCEQVNICLPLTNLDSPEEAVKDKIQRALAFGNAPLIVIEQFIKIKALHDGFIPISDFTLQSLGSENIAHLMEMHQNNEASLLTIVGYADGENHIQLLQERVKGTFDIEELRQSAVFDPNNQLKTYEREPYLERVLRKLKPEKIGFITGVFNPIHLGHLEALQSAKEELGLDRVILVPTVATGHNEKPIAWEHRVAMIRLAIKDLEGFEVVSPDYKLCLEKGTGSGLKHLFSSYPNSRFYHIMGSDSFPRFVEAGHLDDLSDSYRLVVVQREGYPVEIRDHAHITTLSAANPLGEERASSVIRRYLQEQKEITGLVSPDVAIYIYEHSIY